MNDILENIIQTKKASLAKRKRNTPLIELEKRINSSGRRNFAKAVSNKEGVNIIAEIKQASPSAGIIRKDFNPGQIAKEYTEGGAAAISVLTEEEYFKGDLAYLGVVRDNSTLPVLCKDFIFDSYQIYEAAVFGADAVLLITSMLYGEELKDLIKITNSLGLCPLVEVHDRAELGKAVNAGAVVIGINNRNLRDFSVSLDTAMSIIETVPQDKTIVIESGIKTHEDVKKFVNKGVNTFLVGEALMRTSNIIPALKELING